MLAFASVAESFMVFSLGCDVTKLPTPLIERLNRI